MQRVRLLVLTFLVIFVGGVRTLRAGSVRTSPQTSQTSYPPYCYGTASACDRALHYFCEDFGYCDPNSFNCLGDWLLRCYN